MPPLFSLERECLFMAAVFDQLRLAQKTSNNFGPYYDNVCMVTGYDVFTTTSLSTEVSCPSLDSITGAFLTPADPTSLGTSAGNDCLFTDGIITTGAVTVRRYAAGKSGLKFWYCFIGPDNS